MDILEKAIEIIELYDVYQALLTEKQKEYFEAYYYNDYSITEISENYSISRNAVHDQLKKTVLKLHDYESKLKLKSKDKQLKTTFEKIEKSRNFKEIADLINEFEKVE